MKFRFTVNNFDKLRNTAVEDVYEEMKHLYLAKAGGFKTMEDVVDNWDELKNIMERHSTIGKRTLKSFRAYTFAWLLEHNCTKDRMFV